jgi:hypothetical protein
VKILKNSSTHCELEKGEVFVCTGEYPEMAILVKNFLKQTYREMQSDKNLEIDRSRMNLTTF